MGGPVKLTCVACGSSSVDLIINGKPYCRDCGSKVIRLHMYKFLIRLRQENLITSDVKIPEP